MNLNFKNIVIHANHAGALYVLQAFALENKDRFHFEFILSDFAKKVLLENFKGSENKDISILETLPPKNTLCLLGTGGDNQELAKNIRYAQSLGIRTACFLDHWDMYCERFGDPDDWINHLPDEVWTGDRYAHELAENLGFPKDKLYYYPNPYFRMLKHRVEAHHLSYQSTCTKDEKAKILFISEPVQATSQSKYGSKRDWHYTEFSVLKEFLSHLPHIENQVSELKIRLHPQEWETPHKFDKILSCYQGGVDISVSHNSDVLEDILWADIVFGMESVALVVGLIADKIVLSYTPSQQKVHALPHKEIIRLDDMKEFQEFLTHVHI